MVYKIPPRGEVNHIQPVAYIGFLSNTGSEPTKTRKATKSAFNVGPQSASLWNAISMAKPL